MAVNRHDWDQPKGNNIYDHSDFRWPMFKQRFRGYYFLWKSFRHAERKDFDSYVVKVKCSVKGIYASTDWNEYCLRIKDWKYIWSYGMIANSKDVFRTEEECKETYKKYFEKEYAEHIVDTLEKQIERKKKDILRWKANLSVLEKWLKTFIKSLPK